MKPIKISFILFLIITMIGCQEKQENKVPVDVGSKPIEVLFGTEPETEQKAGQSVKIYVEVTQDGQPVVNADEVKFEIWVEREEEKEVKQGEHSPRGNQGNLDMKDYESENEFIEATHQGNGIYVVNKSFEEEGTYTIMYHVTAGGFHAMRPHQIVITNE